MRSSFKQWAILQLQACSGKGIRHVFDVAESNGVRVHCCLIRSAFPLPRLKRSDAPGKLVQADKGFGGGRRSSVSSVSWAFSVKPQLGWGDEGTKQKATAGWLAALPVFEPHWQVGLAGRHDCIGMQA